MNISLPNQENSFFGVKIFDGVERRADSAPETLKRVENLLPVFGITRIANITGLDKIGLPVVMVVRPNSKSLSVSQGKGFTLEAAKVSGVMESIENYHAERLDLEVKFLSYEDMFFKYNVVNIASLSQSADKNFTASTVIPWLKSRNLVTGQEVWIPLELVQTDYTLPTIQSLGYFLTDSNGLASGNTLLEAQNHAICEVIERDALAIWQIPKHLKAKEIELIDLSTIDNELCRTLLDRYFSANILVRVHNITTDIGIPCFACEIIADESSEALKIRPAMGSGCHPCKNIALSKALIEAAQSRLTFISGSRDDQAWDYYDLTLSKDTYKSLLHDFRSIDSYTSFKDIKNYGSETPEDDHMTLVNNLKNNGIEEIYFVDLTKEEFGISVVKIIVPDLQGITNFQQRDFGKRFRRAIRNK